MLNSLQMSEGETAATCAKVHDIRNRYRYTSSPGTRSWNMLSGLGTCASEQMLIQDR